LGGKKINEQESGIPGKAYQSVGPSQKRGAPTASKEKKEIQQQKGRKGRNGIMLRCSASVKRGGVGNGSLREYEIRGVLGEAEQSPSISGEKGGRGLVGN